MDHTRVYVGWDCHDPRALDVCLFSIQRHASDLVEIVSLKPKTVTALCGPDPDPGGITSFAEGIAVDDAGAIWGASVGNRTVWKWVRE